MGTLRTDGLSAASLPTCSSTGFSPRMRPRGAGGSTPVLLRHRGPTAAGPRRGPCCELRSCALVWLNSSDSREAHPRTCSVTRQWGFGRTISAQIGKCFSSGSRELVKGDGLVSLDLGANVEKTAPQRTLFWSYGWSLPSGEHAVPTRGFRSQEVRCPSD